MDQSQSCRYSARTAPRSRCGSPTPALSQSTSAIRVRRRAPGRGNATQFPAACPRGRSPTLPRAVQLSEPVGQLTRPLQHSEQPHAGVAHTEHQLERGRVAGWARVARRRELVDRLGAQPVQQGERGADRASEHRRESTARVIRAEVQPIPDQRADEDAPDRVVEKGSWQVRCEARLGDRELPQDGSFVREEIVLARIWLLDDESRGALTRDDEDAVAS